MDGWVSCPSIGFGAKGAGSRNARAGEPAHNATATIPILELPHPLAS